MNHHNYKTELIWTGNLGQGTASYRGYSRDFSIKLDGKPELQGSADPAFRGDKAKYNPEELLVISLSSCHMLWYLHLCSDHDIVVVSYSDQARGEMEETAEGRGRFKKVVLHPEVKITSPNHVELAEKLHQKAGRMCFIANSCNFPVEHKPTVELVVEK